MKTKVLFPLLLVVFCMFSCEETTVLPPSAKEGFELLLAPCQLPIDTSNININFFKKSIKSSYGTFLFFQNNSNPIKLADVTRSSWGKGLKDVCCVCEYGGSVLPGGTTLYVYNKTSVELLKSPGDSLIFNDVRIDNQTIFIELLSIKNYVDNINDNKILAHPENIKKYYGRYVISSGKLTLDK